MMRTWFSEELETVALFWRILRRDGVTLGFTTHDADLWFDGVLHRASPGMLPSSIRRSAGFEPDSADVRGAITHGSITHEDLEQGRFDGAGVRIGLVDWETCERHLLYTGSLGTILESDGGFEAQLSSRKSELARDTLPRTSPSCRAVFAGPGCNLNARRFETETHILEANEEENSVTPAGLADPALFTGGTLRWLDGARAGQVTAILGVTAEGALVLDQPMEPVPLPGTPVRLREGCDHTLDTCSTRFANAINFRGEPHLPGNDLLQRYPSAL
ncbi:DUF2163 domain-containing protein [Novosphingobium decolorationis]|uniref:DUF2163 domain-containing protein n=1 Tax=Novosphingobium decolorationis TaxID=2698673 RepID=A0ABX8EA71_9SPHN|nr:DUF2163 domain-containing protein [Novosphingobium decolorationis]QVM84936.1 DUF2163 domain-containing protein [Novosphingobium decolorationis]